MKNLKIKLFLSVSTAIFLVSCANGGNEARPKDSLSNPAPDRPVPFEEKKDTMMVDTLTHHKDSAH